MPDDARQRARKLAHELSELLKSSPDPHMSATVCETAAYLERAIDAFHMEAIRFRMYTLQRVIGTRDLDPADQTRRTFDQLKASLEEAGFRTQ